MKYKIEKHIKDALELIEGAIKEEPQYVDDYIFVKNALEQAYHGIGYPIHD
jgi:hypothetical protein